MAVLTQSGVEIIREALDSQICHRADAVERDAAFFGHFGDGRGFHFHDCGAAVAQFEFLPGRLGDMVYRTDGSRPV